MLQLEVAELLLKLAGCMILPEVVWVNHDADTEMLNREIFYSTFFFPYKEPQKGP
jgi:hypothetical protein